MNLRNIIKPYPSPIITGRGIDLDFPMLAGCLALLGLGLVMITSASSPKWLPCSRATPCT